MILTKKSGRVQTDAFWRSARVLVSELSFEWDRFMFLVLFCSNSAPFLEVQRVYDRPTDRRTVGRTERRTHPLIEWIQKHVKQEKKTTGGEHIC